MNRVKIVAKVLTVVMVVSDCNTFSDTAPMSGLFAAAVIDKVIIMKNTILKKAIIPICIIHLLYLCGWAIAGNIDPDAEEHKYAWGENIGWINFEPSSGPGVSVTDTEVTGYAWAENAGWIKMDPDFGGVVNDGSGNLSGDAWGENTGWISLSCQDSGTCDDVEYGVVVDPCNGTFSGCAWGENIGWISFDASGPISYKVTTSWRLDTDKDGIPDCNDNTLFEGGGGVTRNESNSDGCFISTL